MVEPTVHRDSNRVHHWAVALLILFAVVMVYAIYRPIHSDIAWLTDFESARDTAREQNKPLLLYFYADWCAPCHQLSRQTWPDDRVERLVMTSFVPVKIDVSDMEQPDQVSEHYNVVALPTIIAANPDGQPLAELYGFVTADEFVSRLGLTGDAQDGVD